MRTLIFLLLVWLVPQAAFAASEPIIAPAPEWVEAHPIPEANPALRDRNFQTLLLDHQTFYGTEQHDYYMQMAFLVQSVQGLQSIGNIVLPWQPDHSDLIVHKVHIRRGTTIVDLLANGHEFTVLRRENNLESAMLDGTLTAIMQTEGLEVGDVLDVAFTVRRRGGTLPLRGEGFYSLSYGNPVGRYLVRQVWPAGTSMQWAGHGQLERARLRTTALGTELVLDRTNVDGPQPPDQAPARFGVVDSLQVTEFRDWAEISRLMAPHYARASTLADSSPLRAHIDRIATASADPRVRTMAALRLVQDDIRYFALTMGDGNYLPATADQTWTRRYGDCKGKTVTLIALLSALGIEAEPVLVHSSMGDALEGRLPQMGLFDHVIVRARIDGRSYWLDGTRSGDRSLDDLAAATFQKGLPLRESGAGLEAIPFAPPRLALLEQNIVYDASNGLDGRIPVNQEMIFRGDFATGMRLALAQVGREEFLRRIRTDNAAYLPGADAEVISMDIRDDLDSGTFTLISIGTATMDWQRTPGAATHRYRFNNETINWDADFSRPAGQPQDAPFALNAPVYLASRETVILPAQGRGYRVEGDSFERTVAGTRIARTLRMEGGRAVAESVFVRIERELAANRAKPSLLELREITDDEAYIVAPAGAYAGSGASDSADGESVTAAGLVQSGFEKLDSNAFDQALADFDRAIAMAPDWARAHAGRGAALVYLDRLTEAEASLADAMRRDQADYIVQQIYGFLHLRANRPEDALRSFTRALELEPSSAFARRMRAETYSSLGRFDDAITDLDAVLAEHPTDVPALVTKIRIHVVRNQAEPAVAAADALVRSDPANPGVLALQAQTLRRLGRAEAAATSYARAIESVVEPPDANDDMRLSLLQVRSALIADSGDPARAIAMLSEVLADRPDHALLLNSRCWTRGTAGIELEAALVDCDRAVAAEPQNASILDSRALVRLRLGRADAAIADATAALVLRPTLANSLYVRGVAKLRNGDQEGGAADLAAARRIAFDIDVEYRSYGVTP